VAEQAASMVDGLPDMLDELVPSAQLAARAFAIASALAHPAYDCIYLALAERSGTRLVTADRKLVGRLAATQWAGLIIPLGTAAT
jgi:predicted nucleic acid-binding protein